MTMGEEHTAGDDAVGGDEGPLGIVLAGGRSSRFGRDKAAVEVSGLPLVERVRTVARAVLGEVIVVGGALGDWPDPVAHEGPLAAIVHAFQRDGRRRGLVVLACDLPRLDRETVARIAAPLVEGDARVPLVDGQRQWLAAHYSIRALERLEAASTSGERSMRRAAVGLGLCDGGGPWGEALTDADTPEALAAAMACRPPQGVTEPE